MKKIVLITLVIFYPSWMMAQSDVYIVNATVEGLKKIPEAKAFLTYRDGNKSITDSVLVKNGKFTFQGSVSEYVSAQLVLDHEGGGLKRAQDILPIYLEHGKINVIAKDSLKYATIGGPLINKQYILYNSLLRKNSERLKLIRDRWSKIDIRDSSLRKLNAEMAAAHQNELLAREKLNIQFVREHPDFEISSEILSKIAGPIIKVDKIDPLYTMLSEKARKTHAGLKLGKDLALTKTTSVGYMAPDFLKNDMEGKIIQLSNLRGKYIFIDFWASWCTPCRADNPNIIKAYNDFKDQGIQVLGISLDKDKAAWLKAVKEDGLSYTQILDEVVGGQRIADKYAIKAIPQNFLIDPSGKIIARNLRGTDLERELRNIYKSKSDL